MSPSGGRRNPPVTRFVQQSQEKTNRAKAAKFWTCSVEIVAGAAFATPTWGSRSLWLISCLWNIKPKGFSCAGARHILSPAHVRLHWPHHGKLRRVHSGRVPPRPRHSVGGASALFKVSDDLAGYPAENNGRDRKQRHQSAQGYRNQDHFCGPQKGFRAEHGRNSMASGPGCASELPHAPHDL